MNFVYELPPLHSAIIALDFNLARWLIQNGADVNELCRDGCAPLHLAVCRNLRLTQLLIAHGADVSLKTTDVDRYTPLIAATDANMYDRYGIYKVLLENGANCDDRDVMNATPLLRDLRISKTLETAKLLLAHGADIRAVTLDERNTALHYAACNPLVDKVKFLLGQGFHVECTNLFGLTALHNAAMKYNPEVCEYLLENGAMVNRKTSEDYGSRTPLLLALMNDHPKCEQTVKLLLEYGANVCDRSGDESALVCADKKTNANNQKAVIQKIVERELLNLSINDSDKQLIKNNQRYKSYYDEHYKTCMQELQNMKQMKFYNNVSIFHICMGSEKNIRGYARNAELVKALEMRGYGDEFPIFFAPLKERFYLEVKKQRMRNAAKNVLSDIFKFNDSSHPVIEKILSYFKDHDLMTLSNGSD